MSSFGPAEQPRAYVLWTPWALFDLTHEAGSTGRRPLSLETPVEVPAGRPLFLAVPAGARVDIDGRRLRAQRETNPFDLGHHRYTIHSLCIGTRDEDATMTVRLDYEVAGRIHILGHLPRPSWSLGRDRSAPSDPQQERLDLFLLGLVDLIRLAEDPAVAWYESGWARLSHAWTGDNISLTDPPMALIVRHANTLLRLLTDLGRHPRHILSRTRAMSPVDRVQQLDVASVRWLSRQPGRDVYERAGPRQRILAVRRFEDLDTLENRILRDFSARSHGLATAYTKQYNTLNSSLRWQGVDKYRRKCEHLTRTLRDRKIGLPRPPIVPNYVLLQDRRYRRVWNAYREILRRLDEQDECWRWQHRLWADFCKLATQVALYRGNKFETVAESPLRIASEQHRGRWSLVDAHSGVFLIRDQKNRPAAVLSVLWDTTAGHPKLADWMAGLGAAAVLHLQGLEDGRESYLLLWPLHLFGDSAPGLKEIAESAKRALNSSLEFLELADNVDIEVEGLVLVSNFDARNQTVGPGIERAGTVTALRFGTGYGGLRRDIDILGSWLHSATLRLVENSGQI